MSRHWWIAIVAFVIAAAALAAVVIVAALGPVTAGSPGKGLGAGERIFLYGLDTSGNPVPRTGGGMMGMRSGCAACHGSDARGRTTRMFTAPDITYGNLTDPNGMVEPDGMRGQTYTDAEIRTAVIRGNDPSGERLAWPMPRWNLTDAEWNDLLSYLKTLP